MLRRTDDEPENHNNKYRTSADKPSDDRVKVSFSLHAWTDVTTLHSAKPLEERGGYPPGEEPAQQHPAAARRCFLDDLRRLILHDLASQCLLRHQSFLVRIFQNVVSGGCIRLGAVVRIGVFPVRKSSERNDLRSLYSSSYRSPR